MATLKVRCISSGFSLTPNVDGAFVVTNETTADDIVVGAEYELLAVEEGWFRIVDESGEDYLYPAELFELLHDEDETVVRSLKKSR